MDWIKERKSVAEDAINGYDPANVVVSDTVEINAPASVVWAVLTDFPNYNAWNPFCVRAEAELKLGAPLNMKLVNYANPGTLAPNCEYICAIEPEKLISWELPHTDFWPYAARRDQIIEATGPNSCRYHSTDAFFGENGIHVMRFCGDWVKRAFDDSARALKARAEELHGAAQ